MRTASIFILGLGLCAITLSAGCAKVDKPDANALVQSDRPRDTAPILDPGDLEDLVTGNSQFAADLYDQLRAQDGNLFFSPYSISSALAMTYAGARGQTETQMAAALRFTLPQDRLHPAFNALDLALAERAQTSTAGSFQLSVANRIWGQAGWEFLPDFLDTLAVNYGAGLALLDFMEDPEGSRITINDWVSDATADRIPELLPKSSITEDTRLVLTNAVYFKAAWHHQFGAQFTSPAPFTLVDGSQVTVDMMRQTESCKYTEGDGYQAVELPYVGDQVAMVIILPAAGTFDTFEQSLATGGLADILNRMTTDRGVALQLPRFTFEKGDSLKLILSGLGMTDAFDGVLADFSGMADLSAMEGYHNLYISDVIHKAFVRVDEDGTEAAAATAVVVGEVTALPQEPVTMIADRPFIFVIRDIPTQTILFMGRVMDPS